MFFFFCGTVVSQIRCREWLPCSWSSQLSYLCFGACKCHNVGGKGRASDGVGGRTLDRLAEVGKLRRRTPKGTSLALRRCQVWRPYWSGKSCSSTLKRSLRVSQEDFDLGVGNRNSTWVKTTFAENEWLQFRVPFSSADWHWCRPNRWGDHYWGGPRDGSACHEYQSWRQASWARGLVAWRHSGNEIRQKRIRVCCSEKYSAERRSQPAMSAAGDGSTGTSRRFSEGG